MNEWIDDRLTLEHGYTISSPCEPDSSVELITKQSILMYQTWRKHVRHLEFLLQ